VKIDGLPGELRPTDSGAWTLDADGTVTGVAGANTDLFVDPAGSAPRTDAHRLLADPPDDDFQLLARVEVDFASTYDAGVLLLWAGEDTWAKLCFEFSPDAVPMVVSVVTRGVSDDANGFTEKSSAIWLRISRQSGAYAFHASTDGSRWHLIRHFSLGEARPHIGLEVQSPMGPGCTARFSRIAYRPNGLTDLRDGT
jgi:uncharacterized protein